MATKTKTQTKTKDPLDYYAEDTELDERYREQQKLLNTAKKNAQQSADISYRTLQKYLPVQNRMNGLHGLGVSESSMIDANNRYLSRLGEIEESYAAGSASLLNNYHTEKKAAQDETYQNAVSQLSNGTYTTNEELDRYLAKIQGKVSDEQAAHLSKLADTFRPPETVAAQTGGVQFKDFDGTNGLNAGNKFYLQDGYQDVYVVESGGEVSDEAVLDTAESVSEGEAFLRDGKIYLKHGGKVYLINERQGESADYYGVLYRQLSGEYTAEDRKKAKQREWEESKP